jgi:hypothetical protein
MSARYTYLLSAVRATGTLRKNCTNWDRPDIQLVVISSQPTSCLLEPMARVRRGGLYRFSTFGTAFSKRRERNTLSHR